MNIESGGRQDEGARYAHEVRWVGAAGGTKAVAESCGEDYRVPGPRRIKPLPGTFFPGLARNCCLYRRERGDEGIVREFCRGALAVDGGVAKGRGTGGSKGERGKKNKVRDTKAAQF